MFHVKQITHLFSDALFGGPWETRTPDLCNANAALYQLS